MIEDRHSARAPRSRLADRVLDRIRRDTGVNEQPADDEITEEVRKAFRMLTQEQRDVLTLRVVGGLSVEQTAEVVERGVGTVKYLQRKALAKVGRIVPGEVAT
jgi:RNA polymerase sigma-70 factor (ECF subfamily)